jgi:ribose transport system substrate-binding protein
MRLYRFLPLIAAILATAVPSCSRPADTAGKTIGVTLLTRGHMFYRDLEEGLRAGADREKYRLIVTAAEFDLGKQTSQIEDFVARKVDAIIVCPVDSRGVGPAIRKANEAGIPVFTADIAAQEGVVVSHIASDNVGGGRLAGETLARLMEGRGKVAIINQPAITSVLDRVQGFREALAAFPDITVIADVNGQGVRDKSMAAAADVLQAHPDLGGVFGINDDSALGALDAVRQFDRRGVVIVGYDANPSAVDAIRRGTALRADVVQYPKKIGATTIDMIKVHFGGGTPPANVPVEVGLVDSVSLAGTPAEG